jgi:hypothetical protein
MVFIEHSRCTLKTIWDGKACDPFLDVITDGDVEAFKYNKEQTNSI